MALHTYETDPGKNPSRHPHVHLSVKSRSFRGKRLNPKKRDLQKWRELFAEKLIVNGIDASATKRLERGVIVKPEKSAIYHMQKDYAAGKLNRLPKVFKSNLDETAREKINLAKENVVKLRKKTMMAYWKIARHLATSNDQADRTLAVKIANMVKSFPPLELRHEKAVEIMGLRKAMDNQKEI